jgi:hypothetical protein
MELEEEEKVNGKEVSGSENHVVFESNDRASETLEGSTDPYP